MGDDAPTAMCDSPASISAMAPIMISVVETADVADATVAKE
jgi:hypothetical protein